MYEAQIATGARDRADKLDSHCDHNVLNEAASRSV